jgi:hypothetical protein
VVPPGETATLADIHGAGIISPPLAERHYPAQ